MTKMNCDYDVINIVECMEDFDWSIYSNHNSIPVLYIAFRINETQVIFLERKVTWMNCDCYVSTILASMGQL